MADENWRENLTDIERVSIDKPWDRTQKDYLRIVAAGQTVSFGEYDNTDLIGDMVKAGLLTYRDGSRYTSMSIALWMNLTDKGRALLGRVD